MSAGSKTMTATPVTSDDSGIGETLGSKMFLYMIINFSDECWVQDDSNTSNK